MKPSPRPNTNPSGPPRCEVAPEDLEQLGVLHRILALLNEPGQSAAPIAALVEELPVLAARARRAHSSALRVGRGLGEPPKIAMVLASLGNRAFEALLLELLEDLTILRADLDD